MPEIYTSLADLRKAKAAKENAESIDQLFNRYSYKKRRANDPNSVKQDLYKKIQRVALAHRIVVNNADLEKVFAIFYPNGTPESEPKDSEISARLPLLSTIEDTSPIDSPINFGASPSNNKVFAQFLTRMGVDWNTTDAQNKLRMWSEFKNDVTKPQDERTSFLRSMAAKYDGDLAQMDATEKLNLAHLSDSIPKSSGYKEPIPHDSLPVKQADQDSEAT